jgi:hydrogenase maturation protein HypF
MSIGSRQRVRVRVEGTVQGVGFRPFVYRLASELGLAGWVLNDSRGVLIEAEGEPAALARLLERLHSDAPPLAIVERVSDEALEPSGEPGFRITESEDRGAADAAVSPDVATCEDCLAEVMDPANRRHRYPFTNCTNCGPRFTIVRGVPYDRPLTTMASFEMCASCRAEYEDPLDRRFHAQPNACPDCGPSLGIGGFHLACRADDEAVVAELRARKHREERPFALMAPSAETVLELVELDDAAGELLASRERPIVLAPRRPDAAVAPSVAPGARELGVMLPYSPLHHLLLADAGALLVLTSANVSDEPIAYRDTDALERLSSIADLFLLHDRPIETRTDDSVVRVVAGRPQFLRRSRGYVPRDLPLDVRRPVLGCGAELKSTFCLARDGRAWAGHHIGDLKNYETLRSFTEGIAHFERLFAVRPEMVAHDLHPQYLSTKHALELEGVETVGVQHHHAHLASCLAEHRETGWAVGAIFDGTGYGTDGTVWGGELLAGNASGFERRGHLHPVRMPGGERAIQQPWRMASSWLLEALGPAPPLPPLIAQHVSPEEWRKVAELAASGLASPLTSSAGRLFDAVAALCGIGAEVNYEGQAAVELEGIADPSEPGEYPLPGDELLDARETVRAILADLGAGVPVPVVAARFHNGVVGATARACARIADAEGTELVVLSGGVFQNRLLLERTTEALERAGLRVLTPRLLPPNDGGIAFGQVAVAAASA